MMSRHRIIVSSAIAFAIGCAGASIFAQATRPTAAHEVVNVTLPLDLPAIGNIKAATNWRFGRIESVVQVGRGDDVKINIRTEDGTVLETIGPRVLSALARAS